MLSDLLLPMLQQKFPGHGMRIGSLPQPCAIFPAAHPDFGNLEIHDDGDEVTVVAGNFTHGHFSNYEDTLDVVEKEREIVDSVIRFLEDVFTDRVVFWGSHQGSGGWYYPEHAGAVGRYEDEFYWSGPANL